MDNLKKHSIDKRWTLFLDRDGVINNLVEKLYVFEWSDFGFFPGSLEALRIFDNIFGRIVVVTNQSCIAKGLMDEANLNVIHQRMINEIEKSGGRIDKVYYCPHWIHDNCACRKPRSGMPIKAKVDFPEIDFHKSFMVGDAPRDIEMGKKLGMKTVFVTTNPEHKAPKTADFIYNDLLSFANSFLQT